MKFCVILKAPNNRNDTIKYCVRFVIENDSRCTYDEIEAALSHKH